jgi:DNA-3-methyladenine glycosylase
MARSRALPRPLPRAFYARPTLTVARELLGCVVARRFPDGEILRGRIVETEAYVGEEDKACHARAGRTPRTAPLYGPPGIAYVYLTYGMHHLLNAVTEREGFPAAVLIRAAEPLEGVPRMAAARGTERPHLLTSGPAKLCQALGLDLRHNESDLRGDLVWFEAGEEVPDRAVATSPRVGCESAAPPWDLMPWRMFVKRNPFVSPGRPVETQTRGGKARLHRE